MIEVFDACRALRTDLPFVQGGLGVALDLDHLSVFDVNEHPTTTVTHPAGALVDLGSTRRGVIP